MTKAVDASAAMRVALRPREAAEALGVSKSMLFRLLAEGVLGYVRVGSDRRIPMAEIERYLRENVVRAS